MRKTLSSLALVVLALLAWLLGPQAHDGQLPPHDTQAQVQSLEGMGAIPARSGVGFRVWAPNADAVSVMGNFNGWSNTANPLDSEGNGYWYGFVRGAHAGDEYKYWVTSADDSFARIDPYARQVTNSVGNGVIYDHDEFDWQGQQANCPPFNEMVIYEMHVGTFNRNGEGVADLYQATEKLDYLKDLGVNTVQVMPVAEFAGDLSWGYNPAHIFAVESAYGGPDALKTFVREAHAKGMAVILDVVYNHFGPSDLDLWRFDGWSENDLGGIYFYNDWRANTPWGDTRPDYGREEVRRFIHDNAMMWLRDYRVDGLRLDMTPYMRSVDGSGWEIPEGWGLMRWIADSVRSEFPGRILIAEDMHSSPRVTSTASDGAAFHSQWDSQFVHPIRSVLISPSDSDRNMFEVAQAIGKNYGDAFARVIYTESHDEVANGQARVPYEIDATDASNWAAQKRATLGTALTLTAPGIPMLFQGQEFLESGWFRDDVPLDWSRSERFSGIADLSRDLVNLRLNRGGTTRGLTGQGLNVYRVDDANNLLVFQRWADHGPGDDVVVVANLDAHAAQDVAIGLPSGGLWKLRLNSDAATYSRAFSDHASFDVEAQPGGMDGLDWHGSVSVGPYSVLIYSQDP